MVLLLSCSLSCLIWQSLYCEEILQHLALSSNNVSVSLECEIVQKREHSQKAGNKNTTACYQKLLTGFPSNHLLSQDGCQVHMHFKGTKKVLTIRSITVDCFTVHHIR